jgi:hypothetical protein
MGGGYWQVDRDFQKVNMPTELKLEDWWTSDGDKRIALQQTAYHNVVIDKGTKINPWNIRTFISIKEAEDFMFSNIFPTGGVDFYTIRKIYF